MQLPIIIIGTGLAGYQLAREFRKLDTVTPLILITASHGHVYAKPQLSNAQTNKKTTASLATSTAPNMAQQLNAKVRTQTYVTSIDPQTQKIQLSDQTELSYGKLVLACGADVIKPDLTGNALEKIQFINHLEDYAEFEKSITDKKHITILGAGLIGCEFANDLSNTGFTIHVIDPANAPLSQLIPEEIGKLLQASLEKNGVHFHFNCIANKIEKNNNDYLLTLSNQQILTTDLVISAIGLRPHLKLAQTAGIETARGIIVNRYLETNFNNVYALGDCAEVEGHVLPYIAPILNAARALGKTLANQRTAADYPAMPVTVKTPSHPIVICPPPRHITGAWQIEHQNNNTKALFYNSENQLYGFILTNEYVKERALLTNQLPRLF